MNDSHDFKLLTKIMNEIKFQTSYETLNIIYSEINNLCQKICVQCPKDFDEWVNRVKINFCVIDIYYIFSKYLTNPTREHLLLFIKKHAFTAAINILETIKADYLCFNQMITMHRDQFLDIYYQCLEFVLGGDFILKPEDVKKILLNLKSDNERMYNPNINLFRNIYNRGYSYDVNDLNEYLRFKNVDPGIVKYFLNNKIGDNSSYLLCYNRGLINIAEIMNEYGFQPNYDCLLEASKANNVKTIKYLVKNKKIKPDINCLVEICKISKNQSAAKFIINQGVLPNIECLMTAASLLKSNGLLMLLLDNVSSTSL